MLLRALGETGDGASADARRNVITALTSVLETASSSTDTDALLHEHAEEIVDGLLRAARDSGSGVSLHSLRSEAERGGAERMGAERSAEVVHVSGGCWLAAERRSSSGASSGASETEAPEPRFCAATDVCAFAPGLCAKHEARSTKHEASTQCR